MTVTGFDRVASTYDTLWTESAIGRIQRRAVWGHFDLLFSPGESILDLGCGTGADAVHLAELGVPVYAVDSSSEMVRIAQEKGVRARQLRLEELGQLTGHFDGAISNFGALNCIASLHEVAANLRRLLRPGASVALCFLGRVCLWELGHYLLKGQLRKAIRRLRGRSRSSYQVGVFYPSPRKILNAFVSGFKLVARIGVGLTVPPSYVTYLNEGTLEKLAKLDVGLVSRPVFRSLSDHQLYIWRRT